LPVGIEQSKLLRGFPHLTPYPDASTSKPLMGAAEDKGDSMRRKTAIQSLAIVLALALVTPALLAVDIPSGTRVSVRSNGSMSSATAHVGDAWDGTLTKDLVVDGKTLFPAGTAVKGKVTNAKPSGRLHAPGQLTVRLTSIGGTPVNSSPRSYTGGSQMKGNAVKIGGGTAAGAVIGALAGGGKGAAIGAGVGAAAGTGAAAATGKKEATLPSESVMSFTVTTSNASGAKLKKR